MSTPGKRWQTTLLLLLFALACFHPATASEEYRRALVGIKVFAAFVAANQDLEGQLSVTGALPLLVVHQGDRRIAADMAERLDQIGRIRGHPVAISLVHVDQLSAYRGPPPAGIFIAEWLTELPPLLAFAAPKRSLVFSPYLGDVGRGVHGGLYVSDRILPLVDNEALQASGITIKPFFLEVAKHHGED